MRAGRKPLELRVAVRIARSRACVFLRSDFRDLGGYDQVGRSLRSLTAKGKLVRIGYGVYARAVLSPISGTVVPAKPLPALASEALKRLDVEDCAIELHPGLQPGLHDAGADRQSNCRQGAFLSEDRLRRQVRRLRTCFPIVS